MGGPDSLAAIQPFLYNLFSDRELIQLPAGALLQKPFAWMISRLLCSACSSQIFGACSTWQDLPVAAVPISPALPPALREESAPPRPP